jgi:thermostable 8-oxoguanine DNA glycosylase
LEDLRTVLDGLQDKQLAYVLSRAKAVTTAEALRNAGLGKNVYYKWTEEEREHLEEVAYRLQREQAVQAILVLQDSAKKAAEVKVAGLNERDARVRQSVATEILDRTIGKATDKLDVTSGGESIIQVEYVNNPYPVTSVSPESSGDTPESK